MAMVSMGDQVQLHRIDNDRWVELPKAYQLVYDETGKELRSCSFYVLQLVNPSSYRNNFANSQGIDVHVGKKFFTRGTILVNETVYMPCGCFHNWNVVDGIRYRRKLSADGPLQDFEHPYEYPVMVYKCDRNNSYKVELPDGCVVNRKGWIGFVTP